VATLVSKRLIIRLDFRVGAFLVVLATALVVATSARAATVSISEGVAPSGHPTVTLTYEAAAGERNAVAIYMASDYGGWIVNETGFVGEPPLSTPITLVAGAGCTSIDPEIVFCTNPHAEEARLDVAVSVGDFGDQASVAGACGFASIVGVVNGYLSDHSLACGAVVTGGSGFDTLAANDFRLGDSKLYGGADADVLIGGKSGSLLSGGPGRDVLLGGAADDGLGGGGGADTIFGGPGNDRLTGGPGNDRFEARDRSRDVVRGGTGTDRARIDRRDAVYSIERLL
jgi:hypothetical protein